jgi:hypothetical protein
MSAAVLRLSAAVEPGRTDTDPRIHDGRPLADQAWEVLARGEAEIAQAAAPSKELTEAVTALREMLQEQERTRRTPYTIMWRFRECPWAPVRDIETGKALIGESAYDAVAICKSSHGRASFEYGYVLPSGKIRPIA